MLQLRGTYTALATPFAKDAATSIDWKAFDTLLDDQVAGGITGVIPCGTTGESPALTEKEMLELISRSVSRVKGKAQVIAGTGSNATAHAVHLSVEAEKLGVDAVMVVVPYYNKPTQDGLFGHFVAVAKAVRCPVIAYNVPSRTSIDLAADTLLRIQKECPNVIATKEATGNVLRAQEIIARSNGKMIVLSGDDALTLPMIAVGASGVISVTSNVLPKQVTLATRAALEGRFAEALALHQKLLPVHEAMFVEANPAPLKAALALRGKMTDAVRGPLSQPTQATREKVARALESFS